MKADAVVKLSTLKARLGRTYKMLKCCDTELLVSREWLQSALETRALELEGLIVLRIGVREGASGRKVLRSRV